MAFAHSRRRAHKNQRTSTVIFPPVRSTARRLWFEPLEERRLLSASTLDTTFAGTGYVNTHFGASTDDAAYALAIQADGRTVAAGFSSTSGVDSIALVRYNTDGSLDTTFGSGGKVTTMIGGQSSFAETVAIQSDGKIVVGNSAVVSGVFEFMLARYSANGTLDTTFGTGGATTTTIINGQQSEIYSLKIDGSGRIVAAGYTYTSGLGGNRELVATRYTTSGALDTTFANAGVFLQNFGSGSNEADSLAIGPGGTYVLGGDAVGANQDFLVVRLTSTGQLDTTFNGTGSVLTDGSSGSTDSSETVLVDANGSIVDTGVGSGRAILLRYTASGAVDTTFNGTGKLILPVLQSGSSDEIVGAVFEQQHQIVVSGFSTASGVTSAFVDRVTSSGTVDPGFNGGNAVLSLFGGTLAEAYAPAIDAQGRIVIAGFIMVGGHDNFLVARYGSLFAAASFDTTFNTTGFAATQMVPGSSDYGASIGVQADGKVVVAGESDSSGVTSIALVRYNYDGSLDTTFGTGGKVTTMINGQHSRAVSSSLVIQADRKIVIGGDAQVGGVGEFVVARYNTNGTLDTTFGTGGSTTTTFMNGGQFASVQIDSSGRIVAAGFAYTNSAREFVVMRYTASGALDTTFATAGIFAQAFGASNMDTQADYLVIESNGTIVVSGFDFNSSFDFLVVRLTSAGQLDTTFNGTGIVQTDVNGQADFLNGVAVDSHGAILAGGESGNNAALVRYTASGALDTTFNGTGKLILPQVQPGSEDQAYGVALQADGRIVIVGNSTAGGVSTALVDRFNIDGSADPSFNAGSPLLSLFGGTSAAAYAPAIDANGRIMLTGTVTVAGNQEILVARFGVSQSVQGDTLVLNGTTGSDTLSVLFSSATAFSVTLNGSTVNYTLGGTSPIDKIAFHGGLGSDTVVYSDPINIRLALLGGNSLGVVGLGFELDADTSELFYLYGQAADSATITDTTAGGNSAITTPTYVNLTNPGNTVFYQVASFGNVTINAPVGSGDTGTQYSAAGSNWSATPTSSSMAGPGGLQTLVNFQHAYAQSSGSTAENAYLYGSAGADTMIGTSTYTYLGGGSGSTAYFNEAIGYHSTDAFGNGGADVANLYDSSGNDSFVSTPAYAYLTGGSGATLFFNQAIGFTQVSGHSAAGTDTAYFYDSAGNDTFTGQTAFASMVGSGYLNAGFGFKIVAGIASSGTDTATLYDAAGTNNFYGSNITGDLASTTAGTERVATAFDSVGIVQSLGNNDHKFTQALAYAFSTTGTWL